MSQLTQNTSSLDALIAKANALPDAGGGGADTPSAPLNDVCYIDYDGTILYSYSASEFANLSAAPDLPIRDGLTCQGWNWTLANAKTYVAKYGKLLIGATYITSDGKTRIYIRLEKGRLSPYLGLCINGTCVIDWGDDSSNATVTGSSLTTLKNTQHIYSKPGDYVISISVTSGSFTFSGTTSLGSQVIHKNSSIVGENRCYHNTIQKVNIGSNISVINIAAFLGCYSMRFITLPNNITTINSYCFYDCQSLDTIIFPSGIATIGERAIQQCYSLSNIVLPKGISIISFRLFYDCHTLISVTPPDSTTTIDSESFFNCLSLPSVTIPSSVTKINSSAFSQCYGLKEIHFKSATPPTVGSSSVFSGLPSDCVIYVPSGKLSAYKSATNYPASSTYTYMEE